MGLVRKNEQIRFSSLAVTAVPWLAPLDPKPSELGLLQAPSPFLGQILFLFSAGPCALIPIRLLSADALFLFVLDSEM